MVFVSGSRGRSVPRGRGRGVGGVAFQSTHANGGNRHGGGSHQQPAHGQRQGYGGRAAERETDARSHQSAESLRITVGNDQYQDRQRDEHNQGRISPSISRRLGPPVGSISRDDDDRLYRQEQEAYGRARSQYSDRGDTSRSDTSRSDMYPRIDRSDDRDYNMSSGGRSNTAGYGDRDGAQSHAPNVTGSALFPSGAKSLGAGAPIYPSSSAESSSAASKSTPTSSRPLKSILKKKPDPVPEKSPEKPAGLPGIANYMDIDDEEKFLYGDDQKKGDRPSDRGGAGEESYLPASNTNIRSAMQSWQPAATEKTVSGVMSQFANSQSNIGSNVAQHQGYAAHSQYASSQSAPASQPTPAGNDGGDIWNLLARSVQTAQQLGGQDDMTGAPSGGQGQVADYESQIQQSSYSLAQTIPTQSPIQPPSTNPSYDPTIENILKSIGFDFDKSKRMQEKAKLKPEEQFDVNQMSSFLGGGMSHEEMKSKLLEKGKAGAERLIREAQASLARDLKNMQSEDVDTHMDKSKSDSHLQFDSADHGEHIVSDRRDIKEWRDREFEHETREKVAAKDFKDSSEPRNRLDDKDKSVNRRNSDDDEFNDRNRRNDAKSRVVMRERHDSWDASTYSAVLPTEKRAIERPPLSKFERDLSPVSDDDSSPPPMFNLPPITIKRKPNIDLDTRPGWDKEGRSKSRSRTPPDSFVSKDRRRSSRSPNWNTSNKGERSPMRRRSPVVTRVFNLSPRDRSPLRSRHRSPVSRGSPKRRISPRSRHSLSPRRRSRSPRRRSRSPRKRSRSPHRRSISPRRKRSLSPRGRKRSFSPMDRSRDRKIGRRRSDSRSRQRRRSRSGNRPSISPRRRGLSRSSSSDSVSSSDTGPGRTSYFSAPLHGPPKPIPGQYYNNTPVPYNNPPVPNTFGPPPTCMPPVDMYGYPIAPPPTLPPFGMPPGPPPGPPSMSFPPPGFVPPGPPISAPYSIPPPGAPPVSQEPAPPGTFAQMPLNLPVPSLVPISEEAGRPEQKTKRSENSDTGSVRVVKMSEKPKTKSESKPVMSSKEKEQLLKDIDEKRGKIQALDIELDNLKKQQNEQMRKKQKEKDGHKDPILIENSQLQEAIAAEIAKLKQQLKLDTELMKDEDKIITRTIKLKETSPQTSGKDDGRKRSTSSEGKQKGPTERQMMKYSFVDKGDHWCRSCKTVYNNIHEYIEHLSANRHKQTQSSDVRPWRDGMEPYDGKIVNKKGIQVPLPGVEFLVPAQAYYCSLCKTFMGDVSCGIDHFRCESHYFNYQKYVKENKYYEKKMALEKQAGLSEIHRINRALKKKDEKKESDSSREKEVDTRVNNSETGRKTTDNANNLSVSERKNKKPVEKKAGFGKFTWVKPEEEEEEEEGDEQCEKPNPDTSAKSDDGKKGGINIHLSGKTIPKTGGFTKQNPLLPPWKPVGQQNEPFQLRKGTKNENEDASLVDMFNTSSNSNKIPVAGDKKKITAKEILEAFTGKFKDKDIQPKHKSADDYDETAEHKHRSKSGDSSTTVGEVVTSSKEACRSTSKEKSPPVTKIDSHNQTHTTKAAHLKTKEETKVSSSNKDMLDNIPLPTAHMTTPKYSDRSDSRSNASLSTPTQSKDLHSRKEFESIPLPGSMKIDTIDLTGSHEYDSVKTKENEKPIKASSVKDNDTDNKQGAKPRPKENTPTRGRGRGRGRGAVSERRSTRQTRSMAPSVAMTREPASGLHASESTLKPITKAKTVKKSESPIKGGRRTSSGPEMEIVVAVKETVSDDAASDVSNLSEVSMEMGSDFEVVDDIEDTD